MAIPNNKMGTAVIGGRLLANNNEPTVQSLEKEIVVARELAILGDYDTAL
jgi:hypothetical protein